MQDQKYLLFLNFYSTKIQTRNLRISNFESLPQRLTYGPVVSMLPYHSPGVYLQILVLRASGMERGAGAMIRLLSFSYHRDYETVASSRIHVAPGSDNP